MNLHSSIPERLPRIPVTIVGGYLGAGKTTLINRILRQNEVGRLAILVNDFGAINIDADLIEAHNGETMKLTNGCVCCSIAGDLGGALASAATLSPRPDRIVIEASGVADPGRIANFARGRAELGIDGIIVLADVETVQTRCSDRFVGSTVRRQLTAADLIVMTKTDIVTDVTLAAVRSWLCETCEGKPVVCSQECEVAELLTGFTQQDSHARPQSLDELPGHQADHVALTLPCPEPVDRERLTKVLRSLGCDVLRCKGWLRATGSSDTVALVQGVGGRLEYSDEVRDGSERQLCLVVICRNDGRAPERIQRILQPVLTKDGNTPGQARQEGLGP
ncbi:MAG: CobW family GTP-binding protein [Hyphomicrobiaceae bacterium]